MNFFKILTVCIGDRHPSNMLVCQNSGTMSGINFGYAFGVGGILLEIPELVSFRLTDLQSELLEPSGPAGLFGHTLLEAFMKDSTCWEVYSHAPQQSPMKFSEERLQLARCQLQGQCPLQLTIDEVGLHHSSATWFVNFKSAVSKLLTHTQITQSQVTDKRKMRVMQARRLTRLASEPQLLARANFSWRAFM